MYFYFLVWEIENCKINFICFHGSPVFTSQIKSSSFSSILSFIVFTSLITSFSLIAALQVRTFVSRSWVLLGQPLGSDQNPPGYQGLKSGMYMRGFDCQSGFVSLHRVVWQLSSLLFAMSFEIYSSVLGKKFLGISVWLCLCAWIFDGLHHESLFTIDYVCCPHPKLFLIT